MDLTQEEREIAQHIEDKAFDGPGYAIAWSLLKLAEAQDRTATWIKNLGNADAATPMGGLEALGKVLADAIALGRPTSEGCV